MVRALLYLRLMSLLNLLRTHAGRLRRPKYLLGFVFAGAYFYFFFLRPVHVGAPGMSNAGLFGTVSAELLPVVLGLGSLALLTIVFGMWVLAAGKPAFHFSEAEIAFLFPAPVSRRGLVHYKLLGTLFSSLLQTCLFALIFNSRRLFSGEVLPVVAGWWVLLSFISLHFLGVSVTTTRLAERGWSTRRRRILLLALACVLVAAGVLWISQTQPDILLAPSLAEWTQTVLDSAPLSWVLAPFHWLLQPLFSDNLQELLVALAPALALLALQYLWIVRTPAAYEEAALAHATRRAAQVAHSLRTGQRPVSTASTLGRRPPFDLRLARWPELAFLWKNVLSMHPWLTPRAWGICALLLVLGSSVLRYTMGASYWMAGGTLAATGMVAFVSALLYGPLLIRGDLRQDIANADVLKTYPLPGWRIVLGQLLTPTVIVSGAAWLGLLAWVLGLHGHQPPNLSVAWLGPQMRILFCVCIGVVTPLLVALEMLIPNAAPVLLPGWFQAVRTPGAGIDLMGQRLIFGFAQALVVLLALLPAVLTAGLLVFVTQWFAGPAIAVTIATFAVVLVLIGELWCGVWWVGHRFERYDLTEARS